MKNKVLLTGISGHLGSHVAKALLAAGHDLVGLKRRTSSLARIQTLVPDIRLYDLEDQDFGQLFRACGPIDTIIHTATCYGRNGESVADVFSANTDLPLRLLLAGHQAGVKTFINTDTSLDKYFNAYALSKDQFRQWGKCLSGRHGFGFINLNLELVYGPDDDTTKFTAYVMHGCLNNVPELRLSDGTQKRDFIYVDDAVAAYVTLLDRPDPERAGFVDLGLGSGHSIPLRRFVESVHRLTGSRTRLGFGEIPHREGEAMDSQADISGLTAMGWRCRHDLDSGIKLIVARARQ